MGHLLPEPLGSRIWTLLGYDSSLLYQGRRLRIRWEVCDLHYCLVFFGAMLTAGGGGKFLIDFALREAGAVARGRRRPSIVAQR